MTHDIARMLIVTWDDMDMIAYCEAMEAQGLQAVPGWTLDHAAEVLQAGTIDLALLALYHRPGQTSIAFARTLLRTGVPTLFLAEAPGQESLVPPDLADIPVQHRPVGSPAMMAAITRALEGRAFLDPDGPHWRRAARRQ